MWFYVVLSLSSSSPSSIASLFACSIRGRRKACLFGYLSLFCFVFVFKPMSYLHCAVALAMLFSFSDFFYISPYSFQRRTQVCMRWNCVTREERIRLCWIWQKQVEEVFYNCYYSDHVQYESYVFLKCCIWANVYIWLFPEGYKAVLNEMFRVIGEYFFLEMLPDVNVTNEGNNPIKWVLKEYCVIQQNYWFPTMLKSMFKNA